MGNRLSYFNTNKRTWEPDHCQCHPCKCQSCKCGKNIPKDQIVDASTQLQPGVCHCGPCLNPNCTCEDHAGGCGVGTTPQPDLCTEHRDCGDQWCDKRKCEDCVCENQHSKSENKEKIENCSEDQVKTSDSMKEQVGQIENEFKEMKINTTEQNGSQQTVDNKEKCDGVNQEAIEDKIREDSDGTKHDEQNLVKEGGGAPQEQTDVPKIVVEASN